MEIKTIAVIGAGTMGRGIAYAAALGGYRSVLEDVSPEMLEQGTAYISQALEVKLEIFTIFDNFAKPDAILASNTSSLSITEMASITFRAENCIGMHFFNPVPKMKLLEMGRGLETFEAALQTCGEVGGRMGKEVVVIRESPGFVTSRINAMIGN